VWERDRAQAEALKATETRDFVLSLFDLADPDVSQGEPVTAEVLLAEGVRRLGDLTQLDVRADLQLALGDPYRTLGQYEEADSLFTAAVATARFTYGAEHPETALALFELATLRRYAGAYDEAERLHREALAIRRATLGEDHEDVIQS